MNNKKINTIFLLFFFSFPMFFIFKPLVLDLDIYNWYFIFLSPLLLIISLAQLIFFKKIDLSRNYLFTYYLVIFLLILANFNLNELSFSLYLVFIFFLTLLNLFINTEIEISKYYIYIRGIIIIYFFTSLVLTFLPQYSSLLGNEYRYTGIWISPTVCGISSLIYYTTFLNCSSKKDTLMRGCLYIILMVLLVLAKSRLNIFLGILLPFYFYFISSKSLILHKRKLFLSFVFISILFYPIYQYTKISSFDTRLNAADSDASRLAYSVLLLDDFKSSSFIEKVFGHNANSSVSLLGGSIKPHNDFLRIVYDYGVVFLFLYMFILYYYYKSSKYMSFVIVIYIFSFYHNMIFDFFLLIYLILMHSVLKLNNKNYKT